MPARLQSEMSTTRDMIDGERVEVQRSGDDEWYAGTVIRAHKMWVEMDAYNAGRGPEPGHIADENDIWDWRPLAEGSAAPAQAENQFRRVDWAGDQPLPNDDDDADGLPVQPSRGSGIPAADLELLTLAARAIGAVRVETVDGENWLVLHFADGTVVHGWNSLQFSGDAFELLVRLQMHVEAYDDSVEVFFGEGGHVEEGFTGTDPYAATRLAATRAAAEIGRAMA
jgi:hypothetical protein